MSFGDAHLRYPQVVPSSTGPPAVGGAGADRAAHSRIVCDDDDDEERLLPADDADELTWLLFHQQQVLSRRQVLQFMSAKTVRCRVASGRWQVPAPHVYLTHNGPVTRAQRRWAALLAVARPRRAVLAGLTALECEGMRGYRSRMLHVLIPANCQDRDAPRGVVVHRTSTLPEVDLQIGAEPARTVPARALVDAAAWAASDDQARAIVAAGFQQRLVAPAQVAQVLDRMPRVRRRAVTREATNDAAGGAHSLPEASFLRLCRKGRLPLPSRQVRRRDAAGRWRYLDAYFEEWGLHVEIDGSQHMEVRHWWADMRRHNQLWIPGERVLRFPSWVVRHRPDEVIAQIRAALMAAGWRPPAR